jgi:PAS domain S-box-containing protein
VGAEGLDEYVQALVYTSVTDVIFHLRVEGTRYRFLHVNAAFTRSTGLAESDVVSRYVDEIIPEPSLSLVLGKYRQAIAERRTVRWEEVTDYPTGRKVGEVSVTPVFDANGQCAQLIGTVADVTEQRQQRQIISVYADIVRAVQIGLCVWTMDNPDDTATIRLIAYNPATERIAARKLEPFVGMTLGQAMPDLLASPIAPLIAAVARDGEVHQLAAYRSVISPRRTLSATAFPLPDRSIGLALDDITTSHRASRLHDEERRALEMLASGAPTSDILTVIVRMIESLEPHTIVSIELLDETGTLLRQGAGPGLPDEYNRAVDGKPISAKAGSCGTSAFRGKPVYVADILADELWEDYRDLARMTQMRACWSTPVLSPDGRVLGVFAIYHRDPGLPDAITLDLIARATHVTRIVLEARRLDEQLRALAARIEAAREDERSGIARAIHDDLGQAMTALKMDIAWVARRVEGDPAVKQKLAEMSAMTDDVIHSVRRISSDLRPTILDDLGLAATIEWHADEFQTRTGVPCVVRCDLGDLRVERSVSTAVFRIFQEALTNITRHAKATRVDVTLRVVDGNLRLDVADDGIGISDAAIRGGSLGLVGMRERARRLGGDCVVSPRKPHGTLVVMTVPISPRPA